jgi:hypothetical protein
LFETVGGRVWDGILQGSNEQTPRASSLLAFKQQMRSNLDGLPCVANPAVMLARPPVIGQRDYQTLHQQSKVILKLARETLERWTLGDKTKLATSFGWPKEFSNWICTSQVDSDSFENFARPDIILSDNIPKFLELNSHTAIGALVDTSLMPASYFNSHWGRLVTKKVALFADNPIAAIADLLRQRSLQFCGHARPSVALLEWEYDVEMNHRYAALLMQHGLCAQYVDVTQTTAEAGYLSCNGRYYDIAIKNFSLDSLGTEKHLEELAPLLNPHSHSRTLLVPDESASLVSDKRVLAKLSEEAHSWFPEYVSFLERHLPWTRCIENKEVRIGNETHHLKSLLEPSKRADFVLKKGSGEGGSGVVVGLSASVSEWVSAVNAALETNDWVVQEYCKPDKANLSFFCDEGGIHALQCSIVIGQYVVGDEPAGAIVRYSPSEELTVMNFARGAGVCPLLVEKEIANGH